MRIVSVIGAGRIGSAVIAYLRDAPGLRLGRVLTSGGAVDTADRGAFLSSPADLFIDTAGPAALRAHGAACLKHAPLWSVSGSALADDGFRNRLEGLAAAQGTGLRLFAPWVLGVGAVPRRLMSRLSLGVASPGLAQAWRGPLREAALRFPGEVNFAVAAALAGPGLEATDISLTPLPMGGAHRIESELVTAAGVYRGSVALEHGAGHPTALSIIAALEELSAREKAG